MAVLALTYPQLSLLVGAAQIVDAGMLVKRKGELTKVLIRFSFFEYAWAVFSMLEVTSKQGTSPDWFPLSFIAWVVIGGLSGFAVRAMSNNKETIPTVPMWLVIVGGLFGIYFSAASLWLAVVA